MTGNLNRKICWTVTMVALVCMAGQARPGQAFTITEIGTSNGSPGGLPIYQVSDLTAGDQFDIQLSAIGGALLASGSIEVSGISTTGLLLEVEISNDSPPLGINGNPRITSFGLAVDPGIGSGTVSDATFLSTFDMGNFPGFGNVEFCAGSGNNCAGGGSGGIIAGATDIFTLNLLWLGGPLATAPDSITLSQFAFKFQGGPDGASFQIPGEPGGAVPPAQVPMPAAIAIVGLGLVALAASRKMLSR